MEERPAGVRSRFKRPDKYGVIIYHYVINILLLAGMIAGYRVMRGYNNVMNWTASLATSLSVMPPYT